MTNGFQIDRPRCSRKDRFLRAMGATDGLRTLGYFCYNYAPTIKVWHIISFGLRGRIRWPMARKLIVHAVREKTVFLRTMGVTDGRRTFVYFYYNYAPTIKAWHIILFGLTRRILWPMALKLIVNAVREKTVFLRTMGVTCLLYTSDAADD